MIGDRLVAGVELGGTKAVAVLARRDGIVRRVRLNTTGPAETLSRLNGQLAAWFEEEAFAALGIASFGPIRTDPDAEDHGRMLTTPKPGWSNAEIARSLTQGIPVPWRIDTDVNAAALAEWRWGGASDVGSVCYVTVGTGVGGGFVENGVTIRGAMHPEIGHLKLRRSVGDLFAGSCIFHADCIEGLIAGPALAERFGMSGESVPDDHPTWGYVADDLAALVVSVSLTVSPARVVIGGGIGVGRPHLMDRLRRRVLTELNGYLPHVTEATIDRFVVPTRLGDDAGPLGSIALGISELDQNDGGVERHNG